jgi:hypothetical protein
MSRRSLGDAHSFARTFAEVLDARIVIAGRRSAFSTTSQA